MASTMALLVPATGEGTGGLLPQSVWALATVAAVVVTLGSSSMVE